MVEVEVHTIGIDAGWAQAVVLLRETGAERRALPIWIGESDAAALVAARRSAPPPRPDTHTLIAQVLQAFGHRLGGVVITELRGSVFHAALLVAGGPRIDARASDAIGLALRLDVGIEVDDAVMERAAVPWSAVHEPGEDAPVPPPMSESEVERFRRLLDDASPSDFEKE